MNRFETNRVSSTMAFNAVLVAFTFGLLATTTISTASVSQQNREDPFKQWPSLSRLTPSVSVQDQASSVSDMIARLLGEQRAKDYVVIVNSSLAESGHDVFRIESGYNGIGIIITGSTGVAAAMGFQYYAKTYGGCHFSWSGNQVATLTSPPPAVSAPVIVVCNDLFRYYQNVCTVSYSSVWWNWTRWEQEIDWMALNGINLPLAFTGQEAIWRRVYLEIGFSQSDLDSFFSGPAFLAWNRMGNLDGWGGPLPAEYYDGQLELQHQILERMRDFGMIPVLPAFSGHVPATIKNYYPNVNVTYLGDWNGFNSTYCCTTLLDHNDPLFQTIGTSFITKMSDEFGVDHIYNCDTFNEMEPTTNDPDFISGVGQSIFTAMTAADPDAVWLMQGWLFQDTSFWTPTQAKALLLSVPLGRMLVLDLQSELSPQYERLDSYFGQPWIWCMLHNFGGVKGLYGTVDNVNQGTFKGREYTNSTMVGTGLTMEGIEQNDVMYELMNEMAYLQEPVDLDDWFTNFALRRYGTTDSDASFALMTMAHTVFNCTSFNFHGTYVITARPQFQLGSAICYDDTSFLPAWRNFINAADDVTVSSSDLFRHDLVDVTREALVVISNELYSEMSAAFSNKDSASFRSNSETFLDLLTDLNSLLASDRRFLLGPWLASARDLATNVSDASLYEYNARNQITLWGPAGEIVDYATKQWAGIVSDYYLPRWQLFVDQVQLSLDSETSFQQDQFDRDVFNIVESPFTFANDTYAVDAVGDSVEIAGQLYSKWLSNYPVISGGRSIFQCIS